MFPTLPPGFGFGHPSLPSTEIRTVYPLFLRPPKQPPPTPPGQPTPVRFFLSDFCTFFLFFFLFVRALLAFSARAAASLSPSPPPFSSLPYFNASHLATPFLRFPCIQQCYWPREVFPMFFRRVPFLFVSASMRLFFSLFDLTSLSPLPPQELP